VRDAFEPNEIGDKYFSAPNCPIAAVASAVKRHTNNRPRNSMLGAHSGHVGMMMLHCDVARRLDLLRFPCGHVPRMRVVRHYFWVDAMQAGDTLDYFAEMFASFQRIEVTDMRTYKHASVLRERDCVF
jgi:hypothetical protein